MVRQKGRTRFLLFKKKSHGKQKVRIQFLLFKKKINKTKTNK